MMDNNLLKKLQKFEKDNIGKFDYVEFASEVIQLADMEEGFVYNGTCRNASLALWTGTKFIYVRCKFGDEYLEDINHIQDDNGYDCFYPVEKLEKL